MATPFAHTLSALSADTARAAHVAWVLAAVGLIAWGAWLGLGSVTLRSDDGTVTTVAPLRVLLRAAGLDAAP